MTIKRILLVEDDNELVEILSDVFCYEGYEITVSKNAKEALDRLQREVFNLIITDIVMPEMDGFQLILNLKKSEKTKDIPIIVITGSHYFSKEKLIEAGACRVYRKPFEEDLCKEMESLELENFYNKKLS